MRSSEALPNTRWVPTADCGGDVGAAGQDRFEPAGADRRRAGQAARFNKLQPRRGTARDHPGVQRKPAGKDVLLAAADAHTAGGSARTNALYAGIVEDRVDCEPAP
jgi:hypothetical protein